MQRWFYSLVSFLCLMGFIKSQNLAYASTPEELANREIKVWEAYYRQDPVALQEHLGRFIELHYKVSSSKDIVPSYMEALMIFAKTPQQAPREVYIQRVLPLVEKAFEDIKRRSALYFVPKEVALAELNWWTARRGTPEEYDPKNVGRLMQGAYASLYGGAREDYKDAAFLRATAARLRDEYWEAHLQKGEKSLSDEEWANVERKLVEAYNHFPMERLKED